MNQMISLVINRVKMVVALGQAHQARGSFAGRLFASDGRNTRELPSNPLAPDALGRPVSLPIRTICAFRTGVDTVI
jgi:hypothetical protein